MQEFLTWEMLGTFAGAVGATTVLTQIAKRFITRVDPKWIALTFALLISLGRTLFYIRESSVQAIALAVFNGLMVAGSSVGLFEGVKSFGRSVLHKDKGETREDK